MCFAHGVFMQTTCWPLGAPLWLEAFLVLLDWSLMSRSLGKWERVSLAYFEARVTMLPRAAVKRVGQQAQFTESSKELGFQLGDFCHRLRLTCLKPTRTHRFAASEQRKTHSPTDTARMQRFFAA